MTESADKSSHPLMVFLGWQPYAGFRYAVFEPSWITRVSAASQPQIVRALSLFFVSSILCPVKLRVDGVGSGC